MDNSALNCSRPLYFNNNDDAYPYSCVGTCFVIRYLEKLWAVTAKHIFTNNGYEVSQALIPYALNDRRFLPISSASHFAERNGEREIADLILFEVKEDEIEPPFNYGSVYDLDAETVRIEAREVQVVVHGFPDELNHVDYESQNIRQQRASLFGKNARVSKITGCVEMEISDDLGLESHRGFSGAPVFVIGTSEAGYVPYQLWGISLLGSVAAKNFLHVSLIRQLIEFHVSSA